MQTGNWTLISEFILLGLTEDPLLQLLLFVFFLLIYIATLVGNVGIMTLISVTPQLHTPMYFLLWNLSFIDISGTSVIVPIMLNNFLSKKKSISFPGCATQMFLIFTIGSTEVFMLPVMAYDRYVAICNPLLYRVIMNNRVCVHFIGFIYSVAILNALIQTTLTFMQPFCESNKISHFFCDIPPMLKLSCSDTTINEAVLILVAGVLIILSFVIVLISYLYIVLTILKIRSSVGRTKAFSTCSSHFICVTLLYFTLIFMYAKPVSRTSTIKDRVVSVFYTLIIPMLNPLIYSLRNQEVKQAFRRATRKKETV
ncbi:olfactory receptor 5I1-like [Pleurodeles waltl]|uniref:olfactory receptor 5I1-like n=1 Tax=Pleurodeles waltl TaxID=8319 RepID=UPI00370971D5